MIWIELANKLRSLLQCIRTVSIVSQLFTITIRIDGFVLQPKFEIAMWFGVKTVQVFCILYCAVCALDFVLPRLNRTEPNKHYF